MMRTLFLANAAVFKYNFHNMLNMKASVPVCTLKIDLDDDLDGFKPDITMDKYDPKVWDSPASEEDTTAKETKKETKRKKR